MCPKCEQIIKKAEFFENKENKKEPYKIMEDSCKYFGSTYNGRKERGEVCERVPAWRGDIPAVHSGPGVRIHDGPGISEDPGRTVSEDPSFSGSDTEGC